MPKMHLEIDTSFSVETCEELTINVKYRKGYGDGDFGIIIDCPIKIKVPMAGKPVIYCDEVKKTERFADEI